MALEGQSEDEDMEQSATTGTRWLIRCTLASLQTSGLPVAGAACPACRTERSHSMRAG